MNDGDRDVGAAPNQVGISGQKVVTFGGGTGHYYLLRGLAEHLPPENITAIPGTWDDGGSSGRLRTELGVLPPGDARQCLIALMRSGAQREVAQALFEDRLMEIDGPFKGHSVGNLIAARLEQIFRGQDRGMDAARTLFGVRSNIVPISLTDLRLIAHTRSGVEIEGETNVDLRSRRDDFVPEDRIARIHFNTRAAPSPQALQAIAEADKIVFAPGDLYTSILPHLLVDGIQEAIAAARGRLIFVLNLMTKRGETDAYRASDHLEAFLFYLYDNARLDYVVANTNGLHPEVLEIYGREGQNPVEFDEAACRALAPRAVLVRAQLARYLRREHLVRHDPERLATTILDLD